MKVSKKNSGTNMFRMKGGGKTKIARKIAASGLAMLMVAESIFTNDLFGKDTSVVAMAAEGEGTHLENGLVGYYTFENSLKNEAGSGSAKLHKGGSDKAWISGTVGTAAYARGKNGEAYSFAGDKDGVRGDGLELDVKMPEEYTISYWVNPTTISSATSMVFVPIDVDNGLNIANNWFGATFPTVRIWGPLAASPECYMDNWVSSADALCNQWTYITLTGDANGKNALYINGKRVSTGASIPGVFKGKDIFLGINYWDTTFHGLMDDVAVYDRALSEDEAYVLYLNEGVPEYVDYSTVMPSHVSVHDPSIVKDPNTGMYYVFGSHMAWAKSEDLIHWETFTNNINRDYDTIFAEAAKWSALGGTQSSTTGKYEVKGNLWAPDVIWNPDITGKDGKKGKWCMYMSVNGDRWYTSVVLLTADSLEGDWTLEGTVVYSGFADSAQADKTDYPKIMGTNTVAERYTRTRDNKGAVRLYGMNAIDPCVLYDDDGTLWMAYGSWFGGIYMLKLDNKTGLRDYTRTYGNADKTEIANQEDPYQGIKIAGGEGVSGEAPYIQKIEGSYYLFMSYGGLEAAKGYNMRIFKSDKLTGPYVDYSGDDARYTTAVDNINGSVGNRPMSGYQWDYMDTGYVAQGHNSAFVDDDGKSYVVYHTRFNNGTEWHEVRVHQMFVNEDGWLVTAPFEYTSETLPQTATNKDVAGIYQVLFHKLNINYGGLEVVTDETIQFNEDGTVTGSRTGTWEFSKTKGAPYVTMKIGDITYNGVFVQQQKEDSIETTWCFTLLGSDEISVWGYQLNSDKDMAEVVASSLIMPNRTISDINLSVTGGYGSSIKWKSSNEAVISTTGKVTRPSKDVTVTLTAEVTVGKVTVTKDFAVTVYSPKVLYLEDFYEVAGKTKDDTGWISPSTPTAVSVVNDKDVYGWYLKFVQILDDTGTRVNSRGIYRNFAMNTKVSQNYTIDVDAKIFQSDTDSSCFAITGEDMKYTSNNVNYGLASGYILKLEAPKNSSTYTVNGDNDLTVEIPNGKWTHITASVDNKGNVTANINGKTIITEVDGSGILKGIYYKRGRYDSSISIDNVTVREGYIKDYVGSINGNTLSTLAWYDYSNFFGLKAEDNFTINWKFINHNPKKDNYKNYAIAVTTDLTRTTHAASDWYLRADNYNNSLFGQAGVGAGGELNWNWEQFVPMLNDAEIDATLTRKGTDMTFTAVIQGSDGKTYNYKVTAANAPTGSVMVYLGGEDCYLEINDYSVIIDHQHQYGNGVVTPPTCTEDGYTTYTCSNCDYSYKDNIVKASGHDWDEGTITTPSTCTKKGVKTYTCKREGCNETKTEPVDLIPHTEAEPVKENEVPATCTAKGSYDKVIKCASCKTELRKETIETEALGHDWDEGTITTPATCTQKGVKTYTCKREGCDKTKTEPVDLIPHTEAEPVKENEVPATCTAKGSYDKVIKCSSCGTELKKETIETEALGHDWDEGTITTPATCTQKGVKTYTCKREGCTVTRTEEIALIPHTEAEAVKENEVPATCTTKGFYDKVIKCAFCGIEIHRETIETEALGHDWDEGTITTPATCIAEGVKTYTCQREGCDETKEEKIPLGNHTPSDEPIVTKQPTCTEKGERAFACSVCGKSDVKEEIEALGHDWEIVGKIEATCTQNGKISSACKRCDETKEEILQALGHKPKEPVRENEVKAECEKPGSYDEVIYCAVCNEELSRETKTIEALEHEWKITEKIEATCTQNGKISYACNKCNGTKEEILQALGHKPKEAVKENEVKAECEKPGSYDEVVYCEVCNEEISRETKKIEALGHKPAEAVKENEVKAECEKPGSYDEVVYCTVCNKEISRVTKKIETLEHKPADPVKENEIKAECEKPGSYDEVVYCTVCNKEISRVTKKIEALEHKPADPVKENEIKAECEKPGSYDEVVYCTVCNKEISRVTKEIEALEHKPADPVKENEIKAECEKPGSYDEVVYCTVCNKEISRVTKEIEALQHSWVETEKTEATCTKNGEIVYTCTNCNKTRIDIIKAFGHTYAAPKFIWRDNDTVVAEFICTVCNEPYSVDADMSIQTENGMITYTASVKGKDGKLYTSSKKIIALESAPDNNSDMRIVVAGAEEMEVPENLKTEGLDTPQKITDKIQNKIDEVLREQLVIEEGESAEGFAFYDILLQISKDNGDKWEKVTEENFPVEGITITLPYPENTNKDDFDFIVAHMLTIAKEGFKPGDIELPTVTKTDAGIQFTVTSLSPIAVSWTKLEKVNPEPPSKEPESTTDPTQNPKPEEKPDKNVDTADSSRVFIWMLLCAVVGSGFIMLTTTRKNEKKAK